MNDGNEKEHIGKNGMKLLIAGISLLTIYVTPYLNITSISLNMSLVETVLISAVMLGFWSIASLLLKNHTLHTKSSQQPKHILRKLPVST